MSDERFIPGTSRITEIESFHRYFAAAELCRGKKVLDAASGEGYGSAILAGSASEVVGLDICAEAVENAKKKYTSANLSFVCGDAGAMPFADGTFDCAVSFETIEHLDDPEKLLAEIRRVLKPSGFVILSSPNRAAFDRRNRCEHGENVYHKHEMECDELVALMKRFFPNVVVHAQDSFFSSQIGGGSAMGYFVKGKGGAVVRQEALRSTQYTIVIGGGGELPELSPTSYIDADFDEKYGYQPDDEAIVNQFGLRGEFERAGAELATARGELEKSRADISGVRGDLENTRSELEKSRADLSGMRGELENTRSELEKSRADLSGMRGELENTRGELEKSRADVSGVRGELEIARSELVEARGEVGIVRDELAALRGELAESRDKLAETREKLAETGSELAGARRELDASRGEADALRGRLTAFENHSVQIGLMLENERAASSARIAELEKSLGEASASAEHFRNECQSLRSAWSLRIFGRFALRRRLNNWFPGLGARLRKLFFSAVCPCMKGVMKLLLWRKSSRIKLKNSIYARYGKHLGAWKGYQDWLVLHRPAPKLLLESGAGLEVPDDLPLTSIVIPVYNNLEYTLNCLDSIYGIGSKAPFEVIVVDDRSSCNYAAELRRAYPQVRVIRNKKNSGFLLTVNRGAREAKGEYVLFLNNDTRVLPGWLDELATALYHHPEAGMIGSQLIHMKTGTLQESGDLICRNGGMLPLGRGCDPDHPEYTYFREVDFVSAASIILRKRVFDEMNGFDTAYAPAYFEDPDLGLRLRKAGYKNYVMPLSRVMHMEMASYGSALDERCERNRNFFMERWKDYLAEHAVYDAPEDFVNDRRFPRERILYIDAEVPMADRGSGGMDAIFFMNYFLKRGFDVVFHGEYTPGRVPAYTEILLRMGVECVYLPHRKIWEYLESCGWTFSWLFISRIYQARCFDRLLKKYCSQARYIFDTVDLHFVRERLEADLHDDPEKRRRAELTKKFELAVASSADATIVISRDEKKLLEEDYGLANVWHVPQARAIAGRKEGVRRKGAVFIGSAHPPNLDGLRYFHDEILPLLPRDFRLTIVGEALFNDIRRKPEYQDLPNCPQFKFVGFVSDLGDVLNTAQLSVAPLRYGAGTKGKVASSMSYGVPCVSSAFGVEGTGMIDGENILLARTPEEFAKAIRALCDDPELWKKISDGGLKFLEREYDPGKVEAEMDELFDSIRNGVPARWPETPVIPKLEELEDRPGAE